MTEHWVETTKVKIYWNLRNILKKFQSGTNSLKLSAITFIHVYGIVWNKI